MVLAELDEVATCRNMEIARAVEGYNAEVAFSGFAELGEEDKPAKLAKAKALMETLVARGVNAIGTAWRAKDLITDPAVKGAISKNLKTSNAQLQRQRNLIDDVLAGKIKYDVWADVVVSAADQAKIAWESSGVRGWFAKTFGLSGPEAQSERTTWQKVLEALKGALGFIKEAIKVPGELIKGILGGVTGAFTGPLLIVGGVVVAALFVLPKILATPAGAGIARRAGLGGYQRRRPRLHGWAAA